MLIRQKSLSSDRILLGIILLLTFIGFVIRLAAPFQAGFPLNDGGLFYTMIIDLQKTRYTLPSLTTYNSTNIPFAYPPLAFYLTGLLADLLHISVLDLVRLLPAIISGLTIPAFYLLAREITNSNLQIVLALFAFTVLPRTFAWTIMGGGITRSFGLLFALLTMTFAYRFYNRQHATRYLLTCSLLGALTVATHPEATVHTAITALVFYLWKDRSMRGLLLSLGIAVGILALTSPWWGLILSRHGLDPFWAAMNASREDSFNPLVGLVVFFRFLFTEEPFLPILGMLGLIGFFASLAHKQTLLPAWIFILHLIEPRGGTLFMMIPLALLIGYALDNVILPALNLKGGNTPTDARQGLENILRGKTARYFLLFLFAYSTMSAYTTSLKIKQELSLQPADLESFAWVRENTPQDSEFLLVTGQLPLRDAWSEWFPVLAERHSQATVFGYEWVNDGQFGNRVEAYKNLQACAYEDTTCLSEWNQNSSEVPSFVYIWNQASPTRFPLTIYIQQDANYKLVFQNERSKIFEKIR